MSQLMHNFRKHQKVVLAVVGVLIIFVFTVGGIIAQYQQTAAVGGYGKEVVVTYKGGKITEQEMRMMVSLHYHAAAAVQAIGRTAMSKGAQPHGYDVLPYAGRFGIPNQYGEEISLQIRLLADKAKQLGMSVDDNAVKQFLYRLSGNQLNDGDIHEILRAELGERMSDAQFFEQMKTELLAQHMRYLLRTGIYVLPPSEAFIYFERLNRESQIESFPVKVDDFLAKVTTEPSEKEIQELFEKYKDQIDDPDFPEPGFRVPRKIAIQYVKADFNKFLEDAKAQITEEQIKAEYDAGVAAGRFNAASLPELPPSGEEPKTDDAKPETEEPKSDDAAPEAPKPEEKTEEKPAEPAEPKADDKPAEVKPEEPQPETPKEEQPQAEEKPADAPAEEAKPEGACAVQDAPAAADEAAPEEKPAEEKPATEDKPADENPAEEKPAEEKPADTTPAEAPAKPSTEAPATEAKQPEVLPLEKVRDQIVAQLAARPAQQALDAAFNAVKAEVMKHARDTQNARRLVEEEQDSKKRETLKKDIQPFDVAAVAKKHHLEFETLPLTDPFAMGNYDIGRAQARSPHQFGGAIPFIYTAFSDGRQHYQPEQVTAPLSNTEFLYWLTDEQADFVPELKDAREEVIKAWKLAEARKLAQAEAQKMADSVKPTQTLAEAFPAQMVTQSGEFTWLRPALTPFGFGGEPQLNEVLGVSQAGHNFMKAVSQLKVGEVGVGPNQPETIYYVIRVEARSPSDEVLREQFVGGGAPRLYQSISPVAQRERGQFEQQWFDDLVKEYNVDWKREPHRTSEG